MDKDARKSPDDDPEAERRLSDRDQRSSKMDQTLSDRDQTAADEDKEGSEEGGAKGEGKRIDAARKRGQDEGLRKLVSHGRDETAKEREGLADRRDQDKD